MNVKNIFIALLLSSFLFSCKKSSTSGNGGGGGGTGPVDTVNQLQIVTTAGAGVFVFSSKASWDGYVTGLTGTPVYAGVANASGVATFVNVTSRTYWWYSSKGCQSSVLDSAATTGSVAATGITVYQSPLQDVGTLQIQNIDKSNSVNIYINSVFVVTMPPGYQYLLNNQAANVSYTIVAKQLTGLVENGNTQTKSVFVSCGGTGEVAMNP